MSVALAVVRMLVVLLPCAPGTGVRTNLSRETDTRDRRLSGRRLHRLDRAIIGPKFAENTGQHWIVDNRPGAQGIIGVQLASKAPPDGYTLLMFTASHAIHASFYKNLPYDMLKDFAPVSLTSLTVNLLLVNPGVPANSVKELIALAKARPGQLSFGSAGLGSQNHLAMELFKYMTATNMVHIPYKATPISSHRRVDRTHRSHGGLRCPPLCRTSKAAAPARWQCRRLSGHLRCRICRRSRSRRTRLRDDKFNGRAGACRYIA